MFKDKNFGLPKDLIESARSVMEKKDPIGDKIKELNKSESGWETRGVSADGEKAFIKTPGYTATITYKGPANREKFDAEKYKKETEAIKRSPGRFSPNLRLGENHVVKFTSYLKENFHINELTEEEIAWIYENEYVQWLQEGLTIRYLTPEEKAKREKEEREREIEREREERRLHDEKAKKYEKIPMV